MRKLILFIVTLLLLTFTASAYAQQEKIDVYQQKKLVKSVVFQVGLNEYFVNNQTPGVKMDVAPFVENGRTFVPVRFLSNALGVQNQNIFWFGDTGQVKLQEPGFPVVELAVGKVEVLSNGAPVPGVDVAPVVRSDRTFLPARWVANALGYDVDWDPALNLVVCWPRGEPKPDVEAVKAELKNWVWTENGYRVPSKDGELFLMMDPFGICWTKEGLGFKASGNNIDLFLIVLPLGVQWLSSVEGNLKVYDQLEVILESRFGSEFAKEVSESVRKVGYIETYNNVKEIYGSKNPEMLDIIEFMMSKRDILPDDKDALEKRSYITPTGQKLNIWCDPTSSLPIGIYIYK